MDESKKPESSWEDAERLGPYELREQLPQAGYLRGTIYRAIHVITGATALVYKPAAGDEAGLKSLPEWWARYICSSAPAYIAVELERSPESVAPDNRSAEALEIMLEDIQEGLRRMERVLSAAPKPRFPWHLGLVLAGAAAVCALFFSLLHLAPESAPPSVPEPWVSAPPSQPMDPFTNGLLAATMPPGESLLARPLPREPFKGQKRPPCTRHVEVEINGACWGPHELKAPCPDELYEHQGKCYLPMFSAKPPPSSLGQ
ncbi:hypothetical protein [Archangium sp.]|uniref:hypothetical protein n=1 Tax=Archangium sp. TaxID=1872627 RepID=UPI00286C18D5|nr:hypothetical protein [Archangium sp.]